GELGDDGLVDVDAECLDARRQEVAGGDGVERGRQHQGDGHAGDQGAHGVGSLDDVGVDVGQRTVIADGAAEYERDLELHALVHDATSEIAVGDGGGDRSTAPYLVDHAQVVGMAVLDRHALLQQHAERGAQHVRLERVRGEPVAGEQHVYPASAHEPGQVGPSAGVDDRRTA